MYLNCFTFFNKKCDFFNLVHLKATECLVKPVLGVIFKEKNFNFKNQTKVRKKKFCPLYQKLKASEAMITLLLEGQIN